MNSQRIGGIASILNALNSIAQFIVAIPLLSVSADPAAMAEAAVSNPTPFIVQEVFKLSGGVLTIIVIFAIYLRLLRLSNRMNSIAAAVGLLGAVILAVSAVNALTALTTGTVSIKGQTVDYLTLTATVNRLGFVAIAAGGIWAILTSWLGMKLGRLPRGLCYLGFVYGAFSLIAFIIAPVALLVLILGLVWSVWLGVTLYREPQPA